MRMGFIQRGMWILFAPSFSSNLGMLSSEDTSTVMKKASVQYKTILCDIPDFGKNDILLVNILSAAMFASIYLSLKDKPDIQALSEYYERSMNGSMVMRLFLRFQNNYSRSYQDSLRESAEKSQLSNNPYSWRFTFHPGETLDCFDAIFDKCGIWYLMNQLGVPEITCALCQYDYGMAKLTHTIFTREQTLAGGGTVCDCHYREAID